MIRVYPCPHCTELICDDPRKFMDHALQIHDEIYATSPLANGIPGIPEVITSNPNCLICGQEVMAVAVLIPCGHSQFCYTCVERRKNCPECKAGIENKLKHIL